LKYAPSREDVGVYVTGEAIREVALADLEDAPPAEVGGRRALVPASATAANSSACRRQAAS
jgi:hypothetical protein